MADVFISFSAKDIKFGEYMGQGCKNYGLSYFLSSQSLNHGEDWKKRIIKEIKAASTFIFLATPNSIDSDACKHEIGIALGNDVPIIPILYGIEFADLPDWISDFHGVKVEKDNIQELQRCLAGLRESKQKGQMSLVAVVAAIMGLFLVGKDNS